MHRAAAELTALFLGPKAENADVFEKLLLEAYRDHVFWRRNFHPEDGAVIQERDRREPGHEDAIATLSQELFQLLGELKAGVPFFSPRYVGHMTADLTMASMIAQFATMLYNPNNVAAEGSPVTTRLELEVAEQLSAMIGFDPARQWGHLCSGGTVANLEALWVARNLKYLPVAVHWAARELGVRGLDVGLADGTRAPLDRLGLWELLNVPPAAALDLMDALTDRAGDAFAAVQAVTRHGLSGLGFQQFGLRLEREFDDALAPAVVLVPSTAHYSWAKACRVLGIGEGQLVHVPVDTRFRMDPDALAERLARLAQRRRAVIGVVAVVGTTEESAVDRVDLVADARAHAERSHGVAFHLHVDAAWGGYAASVTRGPDGRRRTLAEARADYAPAAWPEEGVYRALCAMERADSVTIDPHKLGFIPYPAGAVSFADRRVRDLVAVEAPYLFHPGASEWGYIGRYILEGSKPGAAAAAVWMSHRVLPLDARGYGRLVGRTVAGALAVHAHLCARDWAPFRLLPLPTPDMNIVCFALGHPALGTLEATNALVDRVYDAMRVRPERGAARPDYFVTKTVLRAAEYGHAADSLVEGLGFAHADYERAGGLAVIRCTIMDPFLAERRGRVDHVAGFATTLRQVLDAELPAVRRAHPPGGGAGAAPGAIDAAPATADAFAHATAARG